VPDEPNIPNLDPLKGFSFASLKIFKSLAEQRENENKQKEENKKNNHDK
jgi:hypothetical protein